MFRVTDIMGKQKGIFLIIFIFFICSFLNFCSFIHSATKVILPESPEKFSYSVLAPPAFSPNWEKVIIPGKIRLDDHTLNLIYEFQLDNGIKNFTTFATF